MERLFKSTAAKIAGLIIASVLASVIVFTTGIIVLFSEEGLYSISRDQFVRGYAESMLFNYSIKALNSVEETNGGWDDLVFQDNTAKRIEKDWKQSFDKDEFPGCDFMVTVNGKKIYSTFKDGKKFAISSDSTHSVNGDEVVVTAYSDKDGPDAADIQLVRGVYDYRNALIVIDFASVIAFIALVIFLMFGAGRRPEDDLIHDRVFIDHIPADLYGFIVAMVDGCILAAGIALFEAGIDSMAIKTVVLACGGLGAICTAFLLVWMMSCAIQIKQKRFWSDMLVVRTLKFILGILKKYLGFAGSVLQKMSLSLPTLWQVLVPAIVLYALALIAGIGCCNAFGSLDFSFFALFIIASASLAVVWYIAYYMKKIDEGTQRILGGDPTFEINTEFMRGPLKRHAEDLGSMGRAVDAAVNERMKSERLKTELITNVSHDIKTPLTSIINYTDLLAAEDLGSDNAREYVEIISRNAQRLKKLAVDVVDASKASTGNVDIKLTDCNLGMMVEQVVGEYSDRLTEKNLTSVMNIPSDDILVSADGRQSWRIFDNMLSNIYKYAQDNTRVYIDVICDKNSDNMAYVCFRNISAAELNISADELMERFVRGDSSRNTEGSGLGLSIASNLAKLQGGKMDVSIDGDLFKVKIGFRLA